MKIFKVAFLVGFLGLVLSSCLSDSRDGDNTAYGNLAITNAEITDLQPAGKVTKITVHYNTSNSCQKFVQFQTQQPEPNTYQVAVVASQTAGQGCTDVVEEKTETLSFNAPTAGTYKFKFWSGNNSDGTPNFYTMDVEIPQPTQN